MDYPESIPKITRHKLSIYEYAGIITQVAEYINSIKDLDKYLDEPQINNLIDPCLIAFELLKNNKIDVQIDRCGYESVLYSQCEKDENIEKEIEHYLNERINDRQTTLIDKIFNHH